MEEVGYVTTSRDFLVYLDGLPTVRVNDLLLTPEGVRGWVNSIHEENVEVLILDDVPVGPGQMFKKSKFPLSVNIGDFLLGRAITPLGVPIDGKGFTSTVAKNPMELEQQAKGIYSRQFINDQFITGFTAIDTLVPIGKGQRELIIGDPHSGKTTFLINLIINQKNTGVICIYASIGKPVNQVRYLIDTLRVNNALSHSIVIAATSAEPAPLIFLAPKTAFTIAEYFQKRGKDVLLILDDMGNHAKIYREISLLGNKSPGRESYPGDIFYQHSHLMERAGKFKPEFGGGSITALPIIEIPANDFTTFIPTNLMSMTDGHFFFKSSLHAQGQRPAIDTSLSVSRVGRQTQLRIQNALSAQIRQVLAQATELETVSRFSSELPLATQKILTQRDQIQELLKQDVLTYIPREIQTVLLGLVFTNFLDGKDLDFVKRNKKQIFNTLLTNPELKQLTLEVINLNSYNDLVKILEKATPTLNQFCK